jgi:hypothetical protein
MVLLTLAGLVEQLEHPLEVSISSLMLSIDMFKFLSIKYASLKIIWLRKPNNATLIES